jgi:HAD superfamily hydrolase (TIGR01509 family)
MALRRKAPEVLFFSIIVSDENFTRGKLKKFTFLCLSLLQTGAFYGKMGETQLRRGRFSVPPRLYRKDLFMLHGVIFDLDGLMFDTERMWATFWEPALASLGLRYSEGLAEDARGTAGESMRAVLRKHFGPDCDTEAIIARLHELAAAAFAQPVPKKPGLDALLAYLQAHDIPMAVASSSREDVVRRHLRNGQIEPYFRAVITGDMVARSKPEPDIFLRAAEALGVAPAECLVLEDSYNGVRAGHAGGFITVMVPDLAPADDEMRALYTREFASLNDVRGWLEATDLLAHE